MKRKLTVALGPWSEHPLTAPQCTYRQVEIDTTDDAQQRVIAVAIENGGLGNDTYSSSATVIDGHQIDNLVGKLLTYVDATYADKEQRTAHKDLVRQTVWDWFTHHRNDGEKTVKFAEKQASTSDSATE